MFQSNPLEVGDSNMIINSKQFNGRVDISDPDPNVMFKMQEKIAIKNKATEYRDPVKGVHEDNVLSQLFFSADNIQIIQNGLRAGVYKMSNSEFLIGPQNIDNLKVIMRSIYLQYAEYDPNQITEQIRRLNKLVLDYAIPTVYKEAVGYNNYVRDQSTLVVPLEMPKNNDRDYKQLELKQFM
jgi:hypothetical protein|uniref:Minor capsid protein P8 central region domain-containing protein n=1 Tax=viral metagenome TaxID=1070528 RepID=A0A6C0IMQ7_9ZZZZ